MRISDRYIGRQVVFGTLFAIVVLSVILVLGNVLREIRPLLVEQHVPLPLLVRFMLSSLPFSLMFTIPWGFLAAVLLVFGRLSSDQELTAFRVAGLSLTRLSLPVFALALVLSGVCMWLNVRVAPQAKGSLEDMLYQEVMRDPRSILNPGSSLLGFANKSLFIEGHDGNALVGFHLYYRGKNNDKDSPQPSYIHAGRVELGIEKEKKEFHLTLDDAFIEQKKENGGVDVAFAGEAYYLPLDFSDTRMKKPRASTMTNEEILKYSYDPAQKISPAKRVEFRAEITRRYSYSFACLAFAFVAVPLGLKSRRRDTSTGLMLSLFIGAGYFISSFVADQFHTDRGATIALWMPNILCMVLGIYLFRRARFR